MPMLPDHRLVQLGNGRQAEYARMGSGGPVVVFENGGGQRMRTWSPVFSEVAKFTTAFAYNRPGFGASGKADTPRTGAHIVEDLRNLLREVGLAPPYVLVGHSLGGLYMQLFARLYPDEVRGLVLVDSPHPSHFDITKEYSLWQKCLSRMLEGIFAHGIVKEELAGFRETGESILRTPATKTIPTIIMLGSRKGRFVSRRLWDRSKAIQRGLTCLFPGSECLPIDSGHFIHRSAPHAVVSAIRRVSFTEKI